MNKLILAALLLIASHVSSAAHRETDPIRITIPGAITSLVINDGITVVLTNDVSKELTVESNSGEYNPLKLELSAGKLTLSRKVSAQAGNVVVYVPANGLRTVIINGVAELTSNAVLANEKLDISIDGESKIRLRTTGKVNIITWNDIEYRTGEPRN